MVIKKKLKRNFGRNYREGTLIHWHQFSTKYIDSWVLEFLVLYITGNNQRENLISLDFYFRSLSGPRNQRKLEHHD